MDSTTHFRGGSGEPLVLLHGFANSWHAWRPVLPLLTERHDVLALTLPGHYGGDPLADGAEATIDALTDGIERALDAAGIETAHVAGNSLGGWLALDLARRGRARSVVGLSPAGGWARGTSAERRVKRLFKVQHAIFSRLEPYADTLVRRPRARRLMFGAAIQHGDRMPPADALARFRGVLGCPVYWELMAAVMRDGPPTWLGEVRTPTLIAWGDHDRVIPSKTYSQPFGQIPGVERCELPGVGHVPMHDDPELIARTILGWTARHAAQPLSAAGATAGGP